MKSTALSVLALPLLLVACQGSGTASDAPDVVWEIDPFGPEEEVMAAMISASIPTEEHAELAKGAGQWNVACSIYMAPGAEPMPMSAKARARTVLGGRYLMEEFSGEMMGQPFEGILYMGFDTLHDEYVAVWMDNMSCWPAISRGVEGADGAIDLRGPMYDALTPAGRPFRYVSTPDGDDAATTRFYDTLPDGSEFLVMEMRYTRAGS